MPDTGGHIYRYFTYENQKFMVTFGDCEDIEARRFIDTISERSSAQLFEAIIETIWKPNKYGVQSHQEGNYLIGQNSTQDFIDTVATKTTFFGLVPFNLVCLANVSFHPFSPNKETRWNVELDFGRASDFHINNDPNSVLGKH